MHLSDLISKGFAANNCTRIEVAGPAGIGKSRLLAEVEKQRRLQLNEDWLHLSCDPILGGSFHPFLLWLRNEIGEDQRSFESYFDYRLEP